MGKVKISIRLSVTAVSHPRKTDTEAETPLPGVFQHDTYSIEAELLSFPAVFFFQPITVKKKKSQKKNHV